MNWREGRQSSRSAMLLVVLAAGIAPSGCATEPSEHPSNAAQVLSAATTSIASATTLLYPEHTTVIALSQDESAACLRHVVERARNAGTDQRRGEADRCDVLINDQPIVAQLVWIGVQTSRYDEGISPVQRSTSIAAKAAAWTNQGIGGYQTRWLVRTATELTGAAGTNTAAAPNLIADQAAAKTNGVWALILPAMPAGSIRGAATEREIRFVGRSRRARVIEPSISALQSTPGSADWARSAALGEATLASPWMQAALASFAASPAQRWRARLALGRVMGLPSASGEVAAADDMYLDPVLESLATQIELDWHHAIDRVAKVDPALARAVASRLVGVIDVGNDIYVPICDADGSTEASLLERLLAPAARESEVADAARVWLESRPESLAWIADDAPGTASGRPLARVGIANLGPEPLVCWAGVDDRASAGDLVKVEPGSVRAFLSPASAAHAATQPDDDASSFAPGDARAGVIMRVRAGATAFRRRACPFPIPATPPGCTIGPLEPDWSARTLLAAGAATGEWVDAGPWSGVKRVGGGVLGGNWLTAGRVYHGSPAESPVVLPGSAESSGQWMLFLECVRELIVGEPRGVLAEPPDGYVRIWLGPGGTPTVIYKMLWSGQVIDESPGADRTAAPDLTARVALERDRLSCWIPLPIHAVASARGAADHRDGSGVIQIGIERMDERGVRSAWPRAMMPWDSEPARAAINLGAWERIER